MTSKPAMTQEDALRAVAGLLRSPDETLTVEESRRQAAEEYGPLIQRYLLHGPPEKSDGES